MENSVLNDSLLQIAASFFHLFMYNFERHCSSFNIKKFYKYFVQKFNNKSSRSVSTNPSDSYSISTNSQLVEFTTQLRVCESSSGK